MNIKQVLWHLLCGFALVVALLPATPQQVYAQDDKTWLLNQINNLRASQGLHAYVWNNQLAAAAQQQSEYMASTGHISHQQSNGSMPSDRAAANGYAGGWIIENIYGGSIATAGDAWNFWLNSGVHYSGLVNQNTNEIGIGVAQNGNGGYYTLVFGRGNINPPPAQAVDNPALSGQPASASNDGDTGASVNNDSGASAPVAPPPTRRPPPTRTWTPTATVPTFTPSFTWTFTPLWTPSETATAPPPTSTAILLPTVVAIAPTDTQPPPVAVLSPSPTLPLEADPEPVTLATVEDEPNLIAQLLPYLVIGQVILIGLGVGTMLMRRK